MSNEKLYRANFTILLAYPEYAVNRLAPTAAELNAQFNFTTNQKNMVFNVSCAVTDDSANGFNMESPDTDSTMSVCDEAAVETPKFQNYAGTLDSFRDLEVDAAGVYNMLRELTVAPDRPLIGITRVGKKSTDPFTIGDVISIFAYTTDNRTETLEDGELILHGARFKPTGDLVINYTVSA